MDFVWSKACHNSFVKAKEFLCKEPCLAIFDPNKVTVLQTDASLEGLGAILKQEQKDGSMKPVAYFSKKLNDCQKRKKAVFLECLAIKEALMYWQHWLLGLHFTVHTDHKPLENLRINSKYDQELSQLMFYLSQFNFSIKYVPGQYNQEADCLSRNPVLEHFESNEELPIVNFIEIDEIILDQKKLTPKILSKSNVLAKNKIYFYHVKERDKIMITPDLAKKIVRLVHEKFGHIGPRQIELKIFPYYFCSNFRSLISDFCHSCDLCIKNKSRVPYQFGHLSHLGPAREPFEIMSLDTIGGFSGNRSPKRYLHLLVDHFTRFAFILTSKYQRAHEFKTLINKVQKNNIKIGTILTDQYSGINSIEFKNFLKDNHINLVFTAVDCPFSNGLNERLNQTLVNRMRCKINEDKRQKSKPWSVISEECVNEYNNTIHSSTLFSPNFLLHGINVNIIPEKFDIKIDLTKAREEAFQNSLRSHERNKTFYDKNKKEIVYKAGDLVYINHGSKLNKNKLDEIRSGPFEIAERISNVMYRVNSGFRKTESNIFHVSKLYPFRCDNP